MGSLLGFLPLLGWYNRRGWERSGTCFVHDVVDYNYLAFICFTAILLPSSLLSFMYGYVYSVVRAKVGMERATAGPVRVRMVSLSSTISSLSIQISQMQDQQSSGEWVPGSRDRASQTSNPDLVFCILKQGEAKAALKLGILVIAFVVSL